jgi:hypothetical protein
MAVALVHRATNEADLGGAVLHAELQSSVC